MAKTLIGALLLSVLLVAPSIAATPTVTEQEKVNIEPIVWQTPNQKVVDIVARLEKRERPRIETDCIVDTNGELSCGVLQFQWLTFVSSMKQYNVAPNATESELQNFWRDADTQRYLAYLMIEDNLANVIHWKNSSIKEGFIDKDGKLLISL